MQNQAARGNGHAHAIRGNDRVQQGLARAQRLPAQVPPMQGLQRFLNMAGNDEEEDWDSDELDDDGDEIGENDDRWIIPIR